MTQERRAHSLHSAVIWRACRLLLPLLAVRSAPTRRASRSQPMGESMFEISSAGQAMCKKMAVTRRLAGGLICLAAALAGCTEEADDLASAPVGVSQDA